MSGQDLEQVLDPLLCGIADDVCFADGLVEMICATMENGHHQPLTGPEMVLQDAPGDAGSSSDLVGARPVETLLEYARHSGMKDLVARCGVYVWRAGPTATLPRCIASGFAGRHALMLLTAITDSAAPLTL